ncbi:uncharacterized protein P884DRAFT_10081 [Thermothelomyces heterothallicus CBS 202.75]|uniref:uncharacterized protein n=1 Tax=Thermothelomyces heterothallicus CBS 202.75 TaxID=1149848 RepID=UPI0037431244
MPFTWESLYSFFSPAAARDPPSEGVTSFFSSSFFSKAGGSNPMKQTDVPMPPNSGHSAAAGPPIPSPAESSTSSLAPSERDYFPPTSAQSQRSPSISSTSTAPSEQQQQQQQQQLDHPQRSHTTPAPASEDDRPPAPRRSATHVVALDPMSREYPKPTQELSLDEMLARKPGKHSLSHYLRNPRVSKITDEPRTAEEFAERARKFEETKQKLRMDREKIAALIEKR